MPASNTKKYEKKYREVIQIRAELGVKKSAGYGLLSESDK